MTKKKIEKFLTESGLINDGNNTYWNEMMGYILFNRTLIVIRQTDNTFPFLIDMHSFRDINFLIKHEVKGIIIGSKKLTKEARKKR